MASKQCPECGVWHPEGRARCQCGCVFEAEDKESILTSKENPAWAKIALIIALVISVPPICLILRWFWLWISAHIHKSNHPPTV